MGDGRRDFLAHGTKSPAGWNSPKQQPGSGSPGCHQDLPSLSVFSPGLCPVGPWLSWACSTTVPVSSPPALQPGRRGSSEVLGLSLFGLTQVVAPGTPGWPESGGLRVERRCALKQLMQIIRWRWKLCRAGKTPDSHSPSVLLIYCWVTAHPKT